MSGENFGRFIFLLKKTYAFCNEINEKNNHDKRRWAEILEITEQSGKKEKNID